MVTSGKNKRRQFEIFDSVHNINLLVDSQEEIDAVNFFCELHQLGLLLDFEYQPQPFKLFDSVDYTDIEGKNRCLFRDHEYTADFKITIDPNKNKILSKEFKLTKSDLDKNSVNIFIDVKGTFAQHDGGRSFSLNQKWVWMIHKKYIYKLVPKNVFAKLGCPKASFYSNKTKKLRKMFQGFKFIPEKLGLK